MRNPTTRSSRVEPFVNGSGILRAGETVEIVTPAPAAMARLPGAIPRQLTECRLTTVATIAIRATAD
jgi:hypothetical protein